MYDSRSGSTLLAREMASRLTNTFVTPEIGFDLSLKKGMVSPKIVNAMFAGHEFVNLPLSRDEVQHIARRSQGRTGLKAFLLDISASILARGDIPSANTIIYKNGTHIRYLRELSSIFGRDLKLIHIVRDPRAVINSKLRTMRPRYPRECMAWGGSLVAAWQWTTYMKRLNWLQQQGIRFLEIRYEDLLRDPDGELARIADYLNVELKTIPAENAYQIPAKELGIHQLVVSGRMEPGRCRAWQQELSPSDLATIESVTAKTMCRYGYQPTRTPNLLTRTLQINRQIPRTTLLVLRHYYRSVTYAANR
ncbi:sulfotransferase family protein [Thermodesulfobacteriota bacterium B35]